MWTTIYSQVWNSIIMMLPVTVIEKLQETGSLQMTMHMTQRCPQNIKHWMSAGSNPSHSLELFFPKIE